jgi:hypothetical protein
VVPGVRIEPDPAAMAKRYGAETTVPGRYARLVCSGCDSGRWIWSLPEATGVELGTSRLRKVKIDFRGMLPQPFAYPANCPVGRLTSAARAMPGRTCDAEQVTGLLSDEYLTIVLTLI